MTNSYIKQEAAKRGVRLWRIAYRLGVTDATFSRRLRKQFSEEETERILSIIDELAREE